MNIPLPIKKLLRPIYVPIMNVHWALFRKPKRYKYLFETIRAIKAVRILEVGTWNGERALQMIRVAHETSPEKKVEYYGYDLFEGMTEEIFHAEISKRPPTEADVATKLSASGADIHLYKGDTRVTMPSSVPALPKMDFIYIDGGHHIETIQSDWNESAKLMHAGTVVIFDDYWRNRADHGCKAIIDALDRTKYNVEVLPVIDAFDNPDFGRLEISFARVSLRN